MKPAVSDGDREGRNRLSAPLVAIGGDFRAIGMSKFPCRLACGPADHVAGTHGGAVTNCMITYSLNVVKRQPSLTDDERFQVLAM